MDLLAAFRVFLRVAETGSFTAVARELGVTQPAVSRQLVALEEHLGARLLHRTTRSLALTEDGQDLLGHARLVLESVERAEGAVGRQAGLTGLVRLGAGVTFGRVGLAPRMHRLLARHPELKVDLVMDDHVTDLVHDGIDVTVRFGELTETSLIARRIGTISLIVVGSADYLARHPEPRTPEDLVDHHCILVNRVAYSNTWRLQNGEDVREIRVGGPFRTNSIDAACAAMNSGLGLARLPGWLVHTELCAGTVRNVLPGWRPAPVAVHAVYPSQRNLAPRTRAVIDFLIAEFRTDPALSGLGAEKQGLGSVPDPDREAPASASVG